MRKVRIYRIAFGIIVPPFLGALASFVSDFIKYGMPLTFDRLGLYLLFAYLIMGMPSILYSLIMEFIVREFITPTTVLKKLTYVITSMILGAIAGSILGVEFLTIGGVVGAICAISLIALREKGITTSKENGSQIFNLDK